MRELVVERALVRLCVCERHTPPCVFARDAVLGSSRGRTFPTRAPSCRRGAAELSLVGSDVPLAEAPLPPALEGRQHALAGQLVHRIRAQVEDLGDLFAVEQDFLPVEHALTCRRRYAVLVSGTARTVKE